MDKSKKTIMDMTPQELLKSFVAEVGTLIDARIRTAETTIQANTDASIKASEERIRKDMATNSDLKAVEERLTKLIRAVEAIVSHKLDRVFERLDNHKKRIEQLEEEQLSTRKN